jgi:hypothetical protein
MFLILREISKIAYKEIFGVFSGNWNRGVVNNIAYEQLKVDCERISKKNRQLESDCKKILDIGDAYHKSASKWKTR